MFLAFVFWFVAGALLVAADQYIKRAAFGGPFMAWLDAGFPYFYKSLYKNFRFAFSLPVPAPLMYAAYAAVIGAIVWHLASSFRGLGRAARAGWTLILAGAVSNVAERAALGYVRDFIYVLHGIFNVADGYILAGIAILLWRQNEGLKIEKLKK